MGARSHRGGERFAIWGCHLTATEARHVTARAPHDCHLCLDPIPAGAVYLRWAWIDGGTATTIRVHPTCDEVARETLPGWTNGDGVEPGALRGVSGEVSERWRRHFQRISEAE